MEIATLEVELREKLGKNKVKKIKNTGLVPGIIYCGNSENVSISLDPRSLEKLYKTEFGKNIIIKLQVKNGDSTTEETVLSHNFSKDAISQQLIHIDFLRVDLSKPIHTAIPIKLVGLAPGVKLGGILIQQIKALEVKCLPHHLLPKLEINVSSLNMGDHIKVSDLQLNKNITVLNGKEENVISVVETRIKGEESAAAAEGAAPAAAGKAAPAQTAKAAPAKAPAKK